MCGMRVAVFSTKSYDQTYLEAANRSLISTGSAPAGSGANQPPVHELVYFAPRLTSATAPLAAGFEAVCPFVQDELNRETLALLAAGGCKLIALRCAGFNNVDLVAARELGFTVVRVPAYSPYAVAEHAAALILALNRKIHRAYARVREGNFALEGLLGFDLHGRTVGIIGVGKIGVALARILRGFGCDVLAFDVAPMAEAEAIGVRFVALDQLLAESDIVSLHCPLTPQTFHLINTASIARMKHGVMLINTSRGAVVDTPAVIEGLKTGRIGYLGIDVYEEEADLFFEDLSNRVLQDDVLARLLTFPNVIVTGHQAFFTHEALSRIAETTLRNIACFARGEPSLNEVQANKVVK